MAGVNNLYLNRLINCIDPGKDAMVSFPGGGLDAGHSEFLKNNVIRPLFNLDALTQADQNSVVGVGDKKGVLKSRIDSVIRLNNLERQQITRLKFSDTGFDARMEGMNLAHDAGVGPGKLFKHYTLVLTPGSVLDPASRDQIHEPKLDGLAAESELSDDLIRDIDMDNILTGISYDGKQGGQYKFTIQTGIPGFEKTIFKFNNAFDEVNTDYFAGNPVKNEYIYRNWNDPTKLSNIQMYILIKELGDTLQVMWLKQLIRDQHLDSEKTALCSSDTVVWLRSLLNEVSCIFTLGNVSTLYPVSTNEEQKQIAQTFMKQRLIDDLVAYNTHIIQTSIDPFVGILNSPYVTFNDKSILDENKRVLGILLASVRSELEAEVADIRQRSRAQLSMDDYRIFIDSNRMKAPFRVNTRDNNVAYLSSFKAFFPDRKTGRKLVFNSKVIYDKLNTNKLINDVDIDRILSGIPRITAQSALVGRGGVRELTDNADDIEEIIRKNQGLPGLVSYIAISYYPEILLISYAYGIALGVPNIKRFDVLFEAEVGEAICSPFVSLLKGGLFEYTSELTDVYDPLLMELCSIGSAALSVFLERSLYSVFVYAYPSLIDFLMRYIHPGKTKYDELNDKKCHLTAMNIYHDLFEAELSLNVLNDRHVKTPMQRLKELVSSRKEGTPERRSHSRKRSGSVNSSSSRGRKGHPMSSPFFLKSPKGFHHAYTHKKMSHIGSRSRSRSHSRPKSKKLLSQRYRN